MRKVLRLNFKTLAIYIYTYIVNGAIRCLNNLKKYKSLKILKLCDK